MQAQDSDASRSIMSLAYEHAVRGETPNSPARGGGHAAGTEQRNKGKAKQRGGSKRSGGARGRSSVSALEEGKQPRARDDQLEHASRHVAAEQRRRDRIKEKLDLLKTRVPFVDPRTNTACFLEAVLQYIDALQARVSQLESDLHGAPPRSSPPPPPMPAPAAAAPRPAPAQQPQPQHAGVPTPPLPLGLGRKLHVKSVVPPLAAVSTGQLLPIEAPLDVTPCLPASMLGVGVGVLGARPVLVTSSGAGGAGAPLLQSQLLHVLQQQLIIQAKVGEIQREAAAAAALGALSWQQQAEDTADDGAAGGYDNNAWCVTADLEARVRMGVEAGEFGGGGEQRQPLQAAPHKGNGNGNGAVQQQQQQQQQLRHSLSEDAMEALTMLASAAPCCKREPGTAGAAADGAASAAKRVKR